MRRYLLIAAVLLSGFLFASSSPAGKVHPKEAWLWTDEERLAERPDSNAREARVDDFIAAREAAASRGRIRPASPMPQPGARPVDVILG
jgi:hypothetical protein